MPTCTTASSIFYSIAAIRTTSCKKNIRESAAFRRWSRTCTAGRCTALAHTGPRSFDCCVQSRQFGLLCNFIYYSNDMRYIIDGRLYFVNGGQHLFHIEPACSVVFAANAL